MSSCRPYCPTAQVVDPPVQVYRDYYHPQIVQVIHPVEIINRHHCVPVPQHCYTYSVKNVDVGAAHHHHHHPHHHHHHHHGKK